MSLPSDSNSDPYFYPPIHVCKQSVEADIEEVLNLKNESTKTLFGDVDVAECLEKCICKSLFNVDNKLVAFIATLDHPNLPVMSHCHWENWIKQYYRLDMASPWNTQFIHYLVWNNKYPDFLVYFLKSFYKNNVHLEQILLVVPPGIQIFQELASHFTAVYPSSDEEERFVVTGLQTVHLNIRVNVLKKLIVRKASEEDNIDVQPLLFYQYDVLKYVFGEFKLGTVVDLKDKNKAILVAEKTSGVTVGLMSLTTDIDYQYINNYFYVPICGSYEKIMTKLELSKQTVKHSVWPLHFITEEDLISFKPEAFDQVEEDDLVKERGLDVVSIDRSIFGISLDDDNVEFRIVDPAMHYLMPKREHGSFTFSKGSDESFFSVDCNTYYGRPSWSFHFRPSVQSQAIDQFMAKDRFTFMDHDVVDEDLITGFKVSLFALHPDLDERYAFDLLEAAFECFPDRNYCLLSLPTFYQGSSLSQYFVRLTPALSRDYPHELYIIHRNSVFSEFKVRGLSLVDYESIADLLENVSQGRKIRNSLLNVLVQHYDDNLAYVLECEGCIVGVAVVSKNFMLNELQPHYKLEDVIQLGQYRWERHGVIRHAVVSAVFLKAAPYFLRQVMHQAGLDTLSYCITPLKDITKYDVTTMTTVLGDMTPVQPRKRIKYDLSALDIYTPEDFVVHQEQEFALFIASEKQLSIRKLELNYRMIVVGASDTALSFLENLIFGSSKNHIRYNNLTLVSIHGLPLELKPHKAGDKMLPTSGLYTREYLARLSLQTHVNILYGIITVINRKEKMICLNNEHWMRYDYLFLFTGLQFCRPVPTTMTGTGTEGCQKEEDLREFYDMISQQCGDNLFLVNTSADAIIALSTLKKILETKKSGKIIVYGSCINSYSCIESLLVFGVPGKKIVLIGGPDKDLTRLDANPVVEKAVLQSLRKVGVNTYHGYSLVNWTLHHKSIQKVMFHTETNIPLTINCLALFCYGKKVTSAITYTALINSGIVYNDGIIINSKFLTNDEFIYAAGPGTKYSSKYRETQAAHAYFSSIEVGRQVSLEFRQLVEPRPQNEEEIDTTDAIIQMKEPVTLVAHLPGDWNHVRISAPGQPLPLECQLHGQGESGPVLITGDPIDEDGPGYFQLSFTVYNTVREITCLSKKHIPYQNLQRLYGKHERLLHNLLKRYNQGLIPDLYAFFSQSWAYAIYTSRFNDLVRDCANIFRENEQAGIYMIQDLQTRSEKVLHKLMSTEEQDTISSLYRQSSVPRYVENLTLSYISEHKLQLPMYLNDADIDSFRTKYSSTVLHKEPPKPRPK